MREELLDSLEDPSAWMPVASGLAQLTITSERGPEGAALRLDFDFKGGGGFVVARRPLARRMPESFAIGFAIRGTAPPNRLELKLADPSGRNVWWHHWDTFEPAADWQTMRLPSSEIEFAWGPAGGGALAELGAIELVIAARSGGSGTVWIRDLRLEDRTYRGTPRVRASSALGGHPAAAALDGDPRTSWRSEPTEGSHELEVDFGEEREYGGLVVRWAPEARPRAFRVATSRDGAAWTTAYTASDIDVERSDVWLPRTTSRLLRLSLDAATSQGCGIAEVAVQPLEFSRSIHAFFESIARSEPRGRYPRWLTGEQSYWTPIGLADGETCAIMNEEGMVEVDRGTFSLEPFVVADGRLITWADAEVSQTLEDGWIPVPSSIWRAGDLRLTTTACAARIDGLPTLYVRYRLESAARRTVRLCAAIRPIQVNPPWQAFGELGGMRRIERLTWDGRAVAIDDSRVVVPLDAPAGFGAARFEQGAITTHLARGALPRQAAVSDPFGYASGALAFDLDLAPGSARDVFLAIPFGAQRADVVGRVVAADGAGAFASALRGWRERLGGVGLHVGRGPSDAVATTRTAAAQVLVNRDGPALQPGPRRYTRSWMRDGAIMAAALLRVGRSAEACEFVRWYAAYQAPDGNVPSIVDRTGPDWLPEHDSHGELIFAVMECFRFTRDRGFLAELWPAVRKAVAYLEQLRSSRLGPEYDAAELRARRGLLPESVSHEGYLAQPVHSYWDDFWALRGFRDAAAMAAILGEEAAAQRIAALRDSFETAVQASLERTIAERQIEYVPGSVEWADFDPTATANAVGLLDCLGDLPRPALDRTFDTYLAGARRRWRGELDWNNYSAYEIRILGALVRLGRRDDAAELLTCFLGDRRPPAWNQWPEITWRNPRSPGHLGDVPHTWIGAEYVLALRMALAYESTADDTLVLAAGVPAAWLDGGAEVGVASLPTAHGALTYRLRRKSDDVLTFAVSGDLEIPSGGIVLRPPLDRPIASVEVNGRALTTFDADSATIAACPAEVVLRLGERRST